MNGGGPANLRGSRPAAERRCVEPTHEFESEARRCGYRLVAGLDEAGRGPLAGPVVAAAVILPARVKLPGVADSKLLTDPVRAKLFEDIRLRALAVGVGQASEREIDRLNILEATRLAMSRALLHLTVPPDFLLLDAIMLPNVRIPQRPIIKGDQLSLSVAAASIVAKVARDRLMEQYHRLYPQYNFRDHKGYGTPEHLHLLKIHGPSPIHRRTFAPVERIEADLLPFDGPDGEWAASAGSPL
ncbi:MAG TPA: ribonuclease HII [Nitrospiraceae bacterium]|nr:ribonuclease HII [Nitrospiraceae bacterium]